MKMKPLQLHLWHEPTLGEIAASTPITMEGGPFAGEVANVAHLHRYKTGQAVLIDKKLPLDVGKPGAAACQREAYVIDGDGPDRRLVWRSPENLPRIGAHVGI